MDKKNLTRSRNQIKPEFFFGGGGFQWINAFAGGGGAIFSEITMYYVTLILNSPGRIRTPPTSL